MKKKFQISSSSGGVRVIVRVEDDSGEKVVRKYQDLTWATTQRLDHLTYKNEHRVTTVMSPRSIDVFIQERSNV